MCDSETLLKSLTRDTPGPSLNRSQLLLVVLAVAEVDYLLLPLRLARAVTVRVGHATASLRVGRRAATQAGSASQWQTLRHGHSLTGTESPGHGGSAPTPSHGQASKIYYVVLVVPGLLLVLVVLVVPVVLVLLVVL